MVKKPISIISTEGKTEEQITKEAVEAFEKFNRVSKEVKKKGGRKKNVE